MALYFLKAYDACTQATSPEQCREIMANAAPVAVKAYLNSYQLCKDVMPGEYCIELFAQGQRSPVVYFIAGAVAMWIISKVL